MNYEALQASDGSGEAIRATVQSPGRSIGSSIIPVNASTNYPTGTFIGTTGTLQSNNTLANAQVFYGTASGGTITITSFAPGYTDLGNSTEDVVVIKPTTEWANIIAAAVSSFASVPTGAVNPFAGSSAPTGWLLCQGQAVSRTTYANLYAVCGTTYGPGNGSTTFNLPDLRGRTPIGSGAYTWNESFANTAVNTSNSEITVTASPEWITGHSVVLTCSGTAPGGLTASSTYYVIVINSTTIQLASSLANAVVGTPISLTSQGTGTNTLTHTGSATHPLGEIGGEDAHALVNNEQADMEVGASASNNQTLGASFGPNSGPSVTFRAELDATNSASYTGPFQAVGGSAAHNNLQPYTVANYIIKT